LNKKLWVSTPESAWCLVGWKHWQTPGTLCASSFLAVAPTQVCLYCICDYLNLRFYKAHRPMATSLKVFP
jgi:hypothetical protein